MPTYDYVCKKCKHQFEAFQNIKDKPLTSCPVCKGKIERLITGGTGLIFKGSGFYITDYQNKKSTTNDADVSASNNGDVSTEKPKSKDNPKDKTSSDVKSSGSKSAEAGDKK